MNPNSWLKHLMWTVFQYVQKHAKQRQRWNILNVERREGSLGTASPSGPNPRIQIFHQLQRLQQWDHRLITWNALCISIHLRKTYSYLLRCVSVSEPSPSAVLTCTSIASRCQDDIWDWQNQKLCLPRGLLKNLPTSKTLHLLIDSKLFSAGLRSFHFTSYRNSRSFSLALSLPSSVKEQAF